jgi:hypothetical protein
MPQKLFDVPNLDKLSTDPEDYDRAALVLRVLSHYAEQKASALRRRTAGAPSKALAAEKVMELLYNDLPDWARW